MRTKNWNWEGWLISNRKVGKRASLPGGMLEVMQKCRIMEDREEAVNRRLLLLCRLAKNGNPTAAEILARHGIRQYTQVEIDTINVAGGCHGDRGRQSQRTRAV